MTQQFHFWVYLQKNWKYQKGNIWTSMFLATLNSGQEVEIIQESTEGKDTENVYTSGVIFFSLEKRREFWHVKTLEEPWGHYLKQNKPVTER